MSNITLIALISLTSVLLLSGLVIYLARELIARIDHEDREINLLTKRVAFAIDEIGALKRMLRRHRPEGAELSSEDIAEDAIHNLQDGDFRILSEESLLAQDLIGELGGLDKNQFEAWRQANRERLENLMASKATLQVRLTTMQTRLEDAGHSLRQLRQQRDLADATAHKSKAALTVTEEALVQARTRLVEQEAEFRRAHDDYAQTRDMLEAEKNALELRMGALRDSYEVRLSAIAGQAAIEARDSFDQDRSELEKEAVSLRQKLQEVQDAFDRSLREKTFIENALLDMIEEVKPAHPSGQDP